MSVGRDDTVALNIFATLIGIGITLATFPATTEWFVGVITFEIISTCPASGAVGSLIANRRVTTAAHIAKQLTNPTLPLRAHREVRVITMLIESTFTTFTSISTRQTEWGVSAAPKIAFERTSLALTLVALLFAWFVAIPRISTAHAERSKLLHRAEW